MTDLLYVVITLIFLAATWRFIVACDRLMEEEKR